MKKLFILIAIIISFSGGIRAQFVPNGGFENWTNGVADYWLFDQLMDTVGVLMQYSPGHTGNHALYGYPLAGITRNFSPAVITTPDSISQYFGYLNFYYQLNNSGFDALEVVLEIEDSTHTAIGGAYQLISTYASAWTHASVPIIYTGSGGPPARFIISFVLIGPVSQGLSPQLNSSFLLDDVGFSVPLLPSGPTPMRMD
ncbi:MAG TPA: hypothetical protein PKN14_11445 [Bacteroidia bacterium]|nr:hypothetical protein [Bacteroidia bacterium]OQB62203.1 MAG: hypothetical protein BWX95_01464 [Bacteroidetes bacterium ADurb.Bin141]HNR49848.1 hypothetical protein [Bacteroidia bacterium]HNT83423.1 hypothetical protein [Bacteroidia bacterium]